MECQRFQTEATRLASLIGSHEPLGTTVLFNNAGITKGSFVRPGGFSEVSPPTAEAFVKALFDPGVGGNVYRCVRDERGWAILVDLCILATAGEVEKQPWREAFSAAGDHDE